MTSRRPRPLERLEWYVLNGADSVSAILQQNRRGIYVLEFENGERYVGQAENVAHRFAQHRHGGNHHEPWPEISAFGFMSVPEGDLTPHERMMLRQQKAEGFVLRNKTWNYDHSQPCSLDEVVPVEVQRHWSTGLFLRPDHEALERAANRSKGSVPRLFTARRGEELLADGLTVHDAVVDNLARLVLLAVPQPTETEGRFWSLSDYPSTAGGRFAKLNVGNLELMYFPRQEMYWRSWDRRLEVSGLFGMVNAESGTFVNAGWSGGRFSKGPDGNHIGSREGVPVVTGEHRYSILVDTLSFPMGSSVLQNLAAKEVMGIRRLAVRSMRNASAMVNARSHSPELSRLMYQRILELTD